MTVPFSFLYDRCSHKNMTHEGQSGKESSVALAVCHQVEGRDLLLQQSPVNLESFAVFARCDLSGRPTHLQTPVLTEECNCRGSPLFTLRFQHEVMLPV